MRSSREVERDAFPKELPETGGMQLKVILALGCAAALQSAAALAEKSYQLVREIPIGGEGRWDILAVDAAARRLYLSHATKVFVIDLEKNAVAGEIADTPGVHAFVAVPEFGRGFRSDGKENKSSVVDLKTLRTITKLDTGENPDAITYETKPGEVYVFNHAGNSATVIDARRDFDDPKCNRDLRNFVFH